MIAMLEGRLVKKDIDQVVISCAGVGYGVWISGEDHNTLVTGEIVELHIYEHIREQSHDLFGFVDYGTKLFFEQLLSVNGVGPKMALAILGVAPANELRGYISTENLPMLKTAKGVGKRVAERIILDLKDKISFSGGSIDSQGAFDKGSIGLGSSADEAVEALTSLGFSEHDAIQVLSKIDRKLSVEERIKIALKNGITR